MKILLFPTFIILYRRYQIYERDDLRIFYSFEVFQYSVPYENNVLEIDKSL